MSQSSHTLPPIRKYSSTTCDILSELRTSGEYADVVLRTDDRRLFQAHRAILCCRAESNRSLAARSLAACSSFFRALFTNGMNETNDRTVDIHGVQGDIMELILDYIYTNELKLDESNILRVLPAANQLQVLGLFSTCEDYLNERLSPENVLGIREFAAFFCESVRLQTLTGQPVPSRSLHETSQTSASVSPVREQIRFRIEEPLRLCRSRFTEVAVRSDEFLELSLEQVSDILNCDELNVKSEEAVFDAIVRWIDHKIDERKPVRAVNSRHDRES